MYLRLLFQRPREEIPDQPNARVENMTFFSESNRKKSTNLLPYQFSQFQWRNLPYFSLKPEEIDQYLINISYN